MFFFLFKIFSKINTKQFLIKKKKKKAEREEPAKKQEGRPVKLTGRQEGKKGGEKEIIY